MADGQKTEKATPKKRRDERKKGNIFFSNDAVSVVVLLACFAILRVLGMVAVEAIEHFVQYCMDLASRPYADVSGQTNGLFVQTLVTFLQSAGPIMAAAVVAALAATFFQTKLLISGESLKPKLSRLSPIQGFKRLFSARSLVEALKGILKIGILLYLIYRHLAGVVYTFSKYLYTDVPAACAHLFGEAFSLAMQIVLVFAVLAGADIFYQWWDYERKMKMTKQEVKEEFKQMEGDPQIKGRIRQLQRQMAQARMMQQVPKADVVIRNPTHFAVALRYHADEDNAPIVLAKGQDILAARIVRTAQEHGIAVIENVPLARALYANAELNREIPPELYNAVAEVLVYLYRLDAGMKQ